MANIALDAHSKTIDQKLNAVESILHSTRRVENVKHKRIEELQELTNMGTQELYVRSKQVLKKIKRSADFNSSKNDETLLKGVCNRCVHRFDHHCIWTNNCVGAFSHRYFILFMVTMLVMFLQGIYVGTGCLLDHAEDIRLFKASYVDNDGAVKPITISVAFQHLFMDLPRLVFLVITLAVLTVLVGIFLIHHLYLVLTNQTTNERYKLYDLKQAASDSSQMCSDNSDSNTENKGKAKSEDNEHSKQDRVTTKSDLKYSDYRPYSRGSFNNFMEVFLPYNFISGRIKR